MEDLQVESNQIIPSEPMMDMDEAEIEKFSEGDLQEYEPDSEHFTQQPSKSLSTVKSKDSLPDFLSVPSHLQSRGLHIHVCKECQSQLSTAFEHCLSKNTLLSTAIDETEDAQFQNNPPPYELIKDPSKVKNTLYVDSNEKRRREREASHIEIKLAQFEDNQHQQQSRSRSHSRAHTQTNNNAPASTSTTIPSDVPNRNYNHKFYQLSGSNGKFGNKNFAGTLYKSILHNKDKEIEALRKKLLEKTESEQFEHGNVEKLRGALQESMKYYMSAEDWQRRESDRLQQDIKYLKTEFSSLMACLVNSEEEKKVLFTQLEFAQKTIKSRDVRIKENERSMERLQATIKSQLEEISHLNDNITQTRRDAHKTVTAEVTTSKSSILQKNLDKITHEYKIASKDLTESKKKIDGLEFELNEMVTQFNELGDAKVREEELNAKLTESLKDTSYKLAKADEMNSKLLGQKKVLESDLRVSRDAYTQLKTSTDLRITSLTANLEQEIAAHRKFELKSKELEAENAEFRAELTKVTTERDTLDADYKAAQIRFARELADREAQIREGQAALRDEKIKTKAAMEAKEQMLIQLKDTQTALEKEQATTAMLDFETKRLRKAAEEKRITYQEQIDKLTIQVDALMIDKKVLQDRIKEMLHQYEDLENVLAEARNERLQSEQRSRATIETLKDQLENEKMKNQLVEKVHRELVEKNEALKKEFKSLKSENDEYREVCKGLMETRAQNTNTIQSLNEAKASLEKNVSDLTNELETTKTNFNALRRQAEEYVERIGMIQKERETTVAQRDKTITELNSNIDKMKFDGEENDRLLRKLLRRNQVAEDLLRDARESELLIKAEKASLENVLDELQQMYKMERQHRLQAESVTTKLDGKQALSILDKLELMKQRDMKMNSLATMLVQEFQRTKDMDALAKEVHAKTQPTANPNNAPPATAQPAPVVAK